MVVPDEITELVKNYLEGGDQSGFGANDPWALLTASGGGLEDLITKLTVDVEDSKECPQVLRASPRAVPEPSARSRPLPAALAPSP